MKKPIRLFSSIILCQAAGVLGSFFTTPAIPIWYQALNKPIFSPPNWLFAPVWIILYTLMGVSLFIVLNEKQTATKRKALVFFAIQLILNSLWSLLFFGLKSPLLGLVEIVLLWVFIVLTIISFLKVRKSAAIILFPYLAWVTFASLLNFSILLLN